ncbi:MAG: hypothetical protein E7532_00775 [Ruminococcaceae bacterium]|nr:hypothetical protein [Oscillospiraceae bacterium]
MKGGRCINCTKVMMNTENNPYVPETENTEVNSQQINPESPYTPPYTEPETPKKKKFNLKKFLLITIPALVVVAAIFLSFPLISSCYMKNFASDKEYLTYIEMKSITKDVKNFAKSYGNYTKAFSEPAGTKGEVTIKLGDSVIDMLAASTMTGEDMEYIDWSFLSEIGIDLETMTDGEKISYDLLLSLSGEDVLLYSIIYDYLGGYMYYGLPELSENYLRSEIITPPQQEGATYFDYDDINEYIREYFPTDDEIEALLIKCARIVYENMNNVTREDTTIEASGISQQVMKFTVNIDKQTFKDIQINLFEALADDEDIKSILNRIQKAEENNGATFDTDLYTQFADYLKENVAELKEKDVEDNESIFKLYTYADKDENIIGRALSATEGETEETVGYYQTVSGDKFGFEFFTPENAFVIKGDGTKEGDAYSGKYELIIDDQKVVTVKSEYEDSQSGEIKVVPEKGLYTMFGMSDEEAAAMKFANLSLEMSFSGEENSWSEFSVGFNMMGQNFISLESKSSEIPHTEIVIPENYIDEENAQQWLESIDVEKLLENLEDAGLPDLFTTIFYPRESL